MSHARIKMQIAEYLVITTRMPLNKAEQILDSIDEQLSSQRCVYCDEPLGNEPCQLRGSMPIHTTCNTELEQEMMMWEKASGIDHTSYLDE